MHRVRLVSKGTGRQQPVGLCIAGDAIHLFTEEGAVRPPLLVIRLQTVPAVWHMVLRLQSVPAVWHSVQLAQR